MTDQSSVLLFCLNRTEQVNQSAVFQTKTKQNRTKVQSFEPNHTVEDWPNRTFVWSLKQCNLYSKTAVECKVASTSTSCLEPCSQLSITYRDVTGYQILGGQLVMRRNAARRPHPVASSILPKTRQLRPWIMLGNWMFLVMWTFWEKLISYS